MSADAEGKRRGEELISSEISPETQGELVVTTVQAVPKSVELPAYAYGKRRVELKCEQTNERKLIVETIAHTAISGDAFSAEFGQALSKEVKVTDPGDVNETYAVRATNQTVSIVYEPLDPKHSQRTTLSPVGGFIPRYSLEYDNEMELELLVERQYVDFADDDREVGSQFSFNAVVYVVIDVKRSHYSPLIKLREVWGVPLPGDNIILTRTEFESIGWQAPAIVTFPDGGTGWSTNTNFTIKPPWVGVHYTIIPHRNAAFVAVVRTIISFNPLDEDMPTRFFVTSPGATSRLIPIPENSIHPAFSFLETTPTTAAIVETYDSSTPTPDDYDPTDFFCVEASQKHYRGSIWVRRAAFISLETPPEDFPTSYTVVNGVVIAT